MSQTKKPTYEQAVKRLEEIAELLESGTATLDESMKLFEESTKLTELCYAQLESFKQRIAEVTAAGETEVKIGE